VHVDELVSCNVHDEALVAIRWTSLVKLENTTVGVNGTFSQTHNSVTHPLQIAQHRDHKTYPTA